MFRATSRPLFRISRAPSARCTPQCSTLRIPASTRVILRIPTLRPYSALASTVSQRGWWQRAWFRGDGTPRSKRKGALYALLASLALLPIPVLVYALVLSRERAHLAWLLVQCYRTDARFDNVDWDDYDSVVDYVRDLVIVIMVNDHKIPQDQVERFFEHVKSWGKEDPGPSDEFSPSHLRVRATQLIFTRAALRVHLIFLILSTRTVTEQPKLKVGVVIEPKRGTVGSFEGLLDIGLLVRRILGSELSEWATFVRRAGGGGEKLLELDSSTVERLKGGDAADWETVD